MSNVKKQPYTRPSSVETDLLLAIDAGTVPWTRDDIVKTSSFFFVAQNKNSKNQLEFIPRRPGSSYLGAALQAAYRQGEELVSSGEYPKAMVTAVIQHTPSLWPSVKLVCTLEES